MASGNSTGPYSRDSSEHPELQGHPMPHFAQPSPEAAAAMRHHILAGAHCQLQTAQATYQLEIQQAGANWGTTQMLIHSMMQSASSIAEQDSLARSLDIAFHHYRQHLANANSRMSMAYWHYNLTICHMKQLDETSGRVDQAASAALGDKPSKKLALLDEPPTIEVHPETHPAAKPKIPPIVLPASPPTAAPNHYGEGIHVEKKKFLTASDTKPPAIPAGSQLPDLENVADSKVVKFRSVMPKSEASTTSGPTSKTLGKFSTCSFKAPAGIAAKPLTATTSKEEAMNNYLGQKETDRLTRNYIDRGFLLFNPENRDAALHSIPDCVFSNLDKLIVFNMTEPDTKRGGELQVFFLPCSYVTEDGELNRNAVVELVLTERGYCIHRFLNNLNAKTSGKKRNCRFKDSPEYKNYQKLAPKLGEPLSTRGFPRDESWDDENYFYARTNYKIVLRFPKKKT